MNGNARELVRRAFMVARAKGKPDWHRMSLAVLKNRLLDITDRNFNEASYGAANFKEFIERLQDQVRIDPNTFPPTVELVSGLDQETPHEEAPGRSPVSIYKGERIRPDLWKAVLDWDLEASYVWDFTQGRVQKISGRETGRDVLPRIGRAEFDVLRANFVEEWGAELAPGVREKLEAWGEHKYPTTGLPGDLGSRWHTVLTREVDARLRNWLRERESSESDDALENELDRYRNAGDTLAIGELLVRSLSTARESDIDRLLANVLANWASVRPLTVEVPSIRGLTERSDSFTPDQLGRAVIHAASRLMEIGVTLPPEVGDLAYRLLDPLKELFGLSDKVRRSDVVSAATAILDEAFAGLRDAVNGFRRTTSVTAKQPSIEVIKQTHRYAKFALQAELPLLRELETMLGPVFRKFCESCERHDPSGVLRRASELRHHIERVQGGYDTEPPYALWNSVLLPIFDHASSLIEEGISATDRFTAPQVEIVGGTFKLDLSIGTRHTAFPVRLRNDGQGMAYGVQLTGGDADAEAHLELSEPPQAFDLMPGSERLVTLSLTVRKQGAAPAVPVEWTCVTANGKTCSFKQLLNFEQQSSQPDWDVLQADPPYAINPIKEKQRLYGRDGVIGDLALHVAAGTSTFLWGQKRVGKTSVLQVLSSELSSRKDVTCITLRMGELAALHEGQIAHTMASRLCEAVGRQGDIPAEDSFGAGLGRLVPFIERLSHALPRQKFVVIIDEFDDLDASFYTGERGRQFVKALRSLSEVGLAFFFVGSERMNAIYQGHASDLNKWANFWLDKIEAVEDCLALITRPVEGVIEFHPEAVKSIVQYCGRNPFYMHLFCSQIFRRCMQERRTYVGESDVDDIRRVLLRV